MADIPFETVDLDDEQRQLFMRMVEIHRDAPRDRRIFLLSRTFGGDTLVAAAGPNIKTAKYDLDVLVRYGLLMLDFSARGTPNYTVSPDGLRYYSWLREQQGRPIEQVEEAMRGLLDASWFSERFPEAHAKWMQAEGALWAEDAERRLSAIGHDAREALQEFADALVREKGLSDEVPANKQMTIARITAVLDKQAIGGTPRNFLDALLAYYGTLTDLVQRQEHAGQKEGEPITWEDARRVVFQTLAVMYEVSRAVG